MIVLVTGGREYRDTKKIYQVLDHVHSERKFTLLVEGDAQGTDTRAGKWALERGVQLIKVPANWVGDGVDTAGTKRNKLMLELFDVSLIIAFSGGSGTSNMMLQGFKRGVEIIDVEDMFP